VPWGKNRAYQIRSVDDHAKHVVDSDVSPLSFVLPTKAWFLFLLNTKTTHKDHVKLSQGRLPPLRITSLVQMVGTTDPGHLSVCYSGWQHLRYHTAEKARVTAPSLGSLFHVVGSYRGADLLAPEKGLRGGGRVGSGRRHLATAAQARDIPPTSSPPRPPPEASGPQRQPTAGSLAGAEPTWARAWPLRWSAASLIGGLRGAYSISRRPQSVQSRARGG